MLRRSVTIPRDEYERLLAMAEVGELAEALFRSGALDKLTVGDVKFADLMTRLGGSGGH